MRIVGRFAHLRVPDAFPAYLRRTIVNLHTSGLEVPASALPPDARGIDQEGNVVDAWLCEGRDNADARGEPVLTGGPADCAWTLYADERGDGRAILTVALDDGTGSSTIHLDPADAGSALRLATFGCGQADRPLLVFGAASADVAQIEWLIRSEPASRERTYCTPGILAPGTCVLFELRAGPGTAVAYDRGGREIGRVRFGYS